MLPQKVTLDLTHTRDELVNLTKGMPIHNAWNNSWYLYGAYDHSDRHRSSVTKVQQ